MASSRSIVLLICLVSFALGAQINPSLADKRVALVIGNSNYKNTVALANPVNDATDVATSLRSLGFQVLAGNNLDRGGTIDILQRFERLARGADAALFFYAGHGMQFGGRNYLMPVDARLEDETSLHYEMTALDDVRQALLPASGPKIIILDACRNNPLADQLSRSITSKSRDVPVVRGFSLTVADDGMLIEYSTQPSRVADDGNAHNSPFTTALLARLREPGVEIVTMFRHVGNDVYNSTKGEQNPEMSVSLHSDFILNQSETDETVWARLRTSSNRVAIHDFIARFPASPYAEAAQYQLERLDREAKDAADAERRKAEQAERDRAAAAAQAIKQKAERADRELFRAKPDGSREFKLDEVLPLEKVLPDKDQCENLGSRFETQLQKEGGDGVSFWVRNQPADIGYCILRDGHWYVEYYNRDFQDGFVLNSTD